MPTMNEITDLLLQSLLSGPGTGAPEFRRDPFSMEQALRGLPPDVGPGSAQTASDEGTPEGEPGGAPAGLQEGTEAGLNTILNLLAGGGGEPGAVPDQAQFGRAAALQTLLQSPIARQQGELTPGQIMIGGLAPLLAGRIQGPILHQQAQAAAAEARRKGQLDTMKTLSEIELRQAQAGLARTRMITAGKVKLGYRDLGDRVEVRDPYTNELVSSIPKGPAPGTGDSLHKGPPVFRRLEKQGIDIFWPSQSSLQRGEEPSIIEIGTNAEGGDKKLSVKQQETLSTVETLDEFAQEIRRRARPELIGPWLGKVIGARSEAGLPDAGLATVLKAKIAQGVSVPKEAVDLAALLEQYSAVLVEYFSGQAVPEQEIVRRIKQIPQITDAGLDTFFSKLNGTQAYTRIVANKTMARLGQPALYPDPFQGAPQQERPSVPRVPSLGGAGAGGGAPVAGRYVPGQGLVRE